MRVPSWPAVWLLFALSLCGLWMGSVPLFVLEAWSLRGEPKPALFQLWALATYVGLPLGIVALTSLAVASWLRARRARPAAPAAR